MFLGGEPTILFDDIICVMKHCSSMSTVACGSWALEELEPICVSVWLTLYLERESSLFEVDQMDFSCKARDQVDDSMTQETRVVSCLS